MRSRVLHALVACAVFCAIAWIYALSADRPVDAVLIGFWSALGVGIYACLSGLFGFDPYRTKLAKFASPLLHYVDRWELRLGQATLATLGCIVVVARLVDAANFVTAVVCGMLAAWTYFALRWYLGGYRAPS